MTSYDHRCECPCDCPRRSKLWRCFHCMAGAHALTHAFAVALAVGNEEDKRRTACTVCERPFTSYQLEPGSGRCPDCVP